MTADDGRDITKTLAHHDAMIGNLAGRMTGVERGLKDVEASIKAVGSDVAQSFADLRTSLVELRGSQGPGLGKIISMILAGGGLIAMSASAITILVLSIVQPDITKLRTQAEQHQSSLEQADRDVRDELKDLRKAEQRRLYNRLDEIEKRLSWTPHRIERDAR